MIRLTLLLFAAAIAIGACSASDSELIPLPTADVPSSDTIEASESSSDEIEAPAPTPTPEPTPVPGALIVTDTNIVGEPGDGFLSLAEAVQVASGRLEVSSLSADEQSLVTGQPGRGVPDSIVVDVAEDEIVAPGGDFFLVEMFGNEGDVIDGNAVQILPSADDGDSRNVMLLGSGDIVVKGFVFVGVEQAISIESAGKELANIRIEDNAFINTVFEDIVVRNSISDAGISNLAIVDNAFAAPSARIDSHRFITVFGGVAGSATGQITETKIDGLEISGNSMTASPGAAAACITIHGAVVELRTEGTAADVTISNVTFSGNDLSGCDIGIELNGGAVLQQNGSATGGVIRGVSIADSSLSGSGSGIVIRGGHAAEVASFEAAPDSMVVTANTVESIDISNTAFSGFSVGIELFGGVSDTETGGQVSANTVAEFSTDGLAFDGVGVQCAEQADRGPTASGNVLTALCAAVAGSNG